MEEILSGQLSVAEIARVLLALNLRAVRAEELAGFAGAMRLRATHYESPGQR